MVQVVNLWVCLIKCLQCLSAQFPFESPIVEVPECPSAQMPWVLRCLSTQVLFECLSASSAWVSKCLECLSALNARVTKCPSSALRVILECLWSPIRVPNFHLSVSRVKKVCKIRNKICKFYHVLPARINHSKGFQKLLLNIL